MTLLKSLRVVVKVGSSSLTDSSSGTISTDRMRHIVDSICSLLSAPKQEVVLVSSGAVAAGSGKLQWRRPIRTVPEKQAAASVGQGILIDAYERLFGAHGITVGQILLTRSDIEERRRYIHIQNTIETLLRHGVVPIVNENDTVAVDEIRFGDNDTLAALVALVTGADMLILLTDIGGLYSGDPRVDPAATLVPEVREIDASLRHMAGGQGSAVGTGGMRTKLVAAEIAISSGIETVVAASHLPDVIRRIAQGERIGTRFVAQQSRGAKKSWVAYGSRVEGRVVIDDGAAQALVRMNGSLLVPGLEAVHGEFEEGAIVELASVGGQPIGKGVVNFSSRELHELLQRKTDGERFRGLPEVVHRNNLALAEPRKLGRVMS